MTESTHPSHSDLMFDVHYGHWYNLKCERLYRHLDLALNFVQIVGGSGAAVAVVSQSGVVLSIVGVCLAVAAALSLLVHPAVKAEAHARAKCGYTKLMAEGPCLQVDTLATRLADVRVDAPTGPAVLAAPAFNATLRAMGHNSGFMEESRCQRLANVFS